MYQAKSEENQVSGGGGKNQSFPEWPERHFSLGFFKN